MAAHLPVQETLTQDPLLAPEVSAVEPHIALHLLVVDVQQLQFHLMVARPVPLRAHHQVCQPVTHTAHHLQHQYPQDQVQVGTLTAAHQVETLLLSEVVAHMELPQLHLHHRLPTEALPDLLQAQILTLVLRQAALDY